MKVTAKSHDLLIIDNQPWIWAVLLLVGAFVFVGITYFTVVIEDQLMGLMMLLGVAWCLFFFVHVSRRTQVVFNANEGWMEIRTRTFFGYNAVRHALQEIERAKVETLQGKETESHRVIFVIPEGQSKGHHPMTVLHYAGPAAHKAAAVINAWLDSYRQRT